MKFKRYGGIDHFRMIAAFLVVAIHIAPLSYWNENIDYLITYCLGRVAVPFFFMITGYFVIAPYIKNGFATKRKIYRYLIKNGVMYLGATILYMPINLYAGNFRIDFWDIIKMLIMDSTFYHLWYFPAMIIGCIIIIGLCKKSVAGAALFSMAMYVIGLLGDSYYGFTSKVPILVAIFNVVFSISSYTRNGVFFAPAFLVLGTFIALQKGHYRIKDCVVGVSVSVLFMLLEGYITYSIGWQKHNSMYIFLLPTMYFLFHLLLLVQTKAAVWMRDFSGMIYVIHPAIIILLRGIAKYTRSTTVLIKNTFIQYICVILLSVAVATVCSFIIRKRKLKCV